MTVCSRRRYRRFGPLGTAERAPAGTILSKRIFGSGMYSVVHRFHVYCLVLFFAMSFAITFVMGALSLSKHGCNHILGPDWYFTSSSAFVLLHHFLSSVFSFCCTLTSTLHPTCSSIVVRESHGDDYRLRRRAPALRPPRPPRRQICCQHGRS